MSTGNEVSEYISVTRAASSGAVVVQVTVSTPRAQMQYSWKCSEMKLAEGVAFAKQQAHKLLAEVLSGA